MKYRVSGRVSLLDGSGTGYRVGFGSSRSDAIGYFRVSLLVSGIFRYFGYFDPIPVSSYFDPIPVSSYQRLSGGDPGAGPPGCIHYSSEHSLKTCNRCCMSEQKTKLVS